MDKDKEILPYDTKKKKNNNDLSPSELRKSMKNSGKSTHARASAC